MHNSENDNCKYKECQYTTNTNFYLLIPLPLDTVQRCSEWSTKQISSYQKFCYKLFFYSSLSDLYIYITINQLIMKLN
jgi:hypothetical protein